MNLGYRRVFNHQDFKHSTLLLRHFHFPKDLRRYMKRFMYDYICPCNPIFYGLKRWSRDQAMIYEAFQTHLINFVSFPVNERFGKTTLIQGIAETCVKNDASVLVVSSKPITQRRMREMLGNDTPKLVLTSQLSRITRSFDVILIDDFDRIEKSYFFNQVLPLLQLKNVRLLCVGRTNDFVKEIAELNIAHVIQIEDGQLKLPEIWKDDKIKKLKALYK